MVCMAKHCYVLCAMHRKSSSLLSNFPGVARRNGNDDTRSAYEIVASMFFHCKSITLHPQTYRSSCPPSFRSSSCDPPQTPYHQTLTIVSSLYPLSIDPAATSPFTSLLLSFPRSAEHVRFLISEPFRRPSSFYPLYRNF